MRNELEIIETIERYLAGSLSTEERLAFEKQLAEDPDLQEAVRLQQNILDGLERTTWKAPIARARTHYRQGCLFKGGGLGLGGALIIAALIWVLRPGTLQNTQGQPAAHLSDSARGSSATPGSAAAAIASSGNGRDTLGRRKDTSANQVDSRDAVQTAGGLVKDTTITTSMPAQPAAPILTDAEKALPAQNFRIDAMKDTVLETDGGVLLSVPAGSFRQGDGSIATGNVDMIVREALTPSAIMRAGLSTVSGGTVLETGGMFFVDASKDGKALQLDSVQGIYAQVPADTIRPGMQLYTGKPGANGTIDWIDPRPLEHDLTTVDVGLLNFYPPGWLDSLAHWGYDSYNKHFTDSLYYSFAQFFAPGDDEAQPPPVGVPEIRPGDKRSSRPDVDAVTRPVTRSMIRDTVILPCGLNPARIKAIWNRTFQNTLISTREFEERLPWIHRSDNEALLDLYVRNLDKPLYVIDSLAAHALRGKNVPLSARFLAFAARHDGRVNISSRQADNLRSYYEQKVRVFTQAIAQTEKAFWDKQQALDKIADQRLQEHEKDSMARESQNLKEEVEVNLKTICKQLGYDPKIVTRPPAKHAFEIRLRVLGWCNIDRPTQERVSFTVVDETTSRTANIDYQFVNFQVVGPEHYTRIYVYLLPHELSSFMRMSGNTGYFTGKLNAAMHYDLVCIGYRGEKPYYYYQKNYTAGDHRAETLESIDEAELEQLLDAVAGKTQAADLQRENAYFRFEIRDMGRREMVRKISELQCEVMRKFFPCIVLRVNRCRNDKRV